MENRYQNPELARLYANYLSSKNGQIYQSVIINILQKILLPGDARILDAACGTGWLTDAISKTHKNVFGCDVSAELINLAQKNYPELNFQAADLCAPLPYTAESFDQIILCLAIQDIHDQKQALLNLYGALKPNGKISIILANPYYAFPVGVWKRGFWRFLLRQKPKLKLNQAYYSNPRPINDFSLGPSSAFQPLSEILNNTTSVGFILANYVDIKTPEGSGEFNLQYQLSRFPILLLMEFVKPGQRN